MCLFNWKDSIPEEEGDAKWNLRSEGSWCDAHGNSGQTHVPMKRVSWKAYRMLFALLYNDQYWTCERDISAEPCYPFARIVSRHWHFDVLGELLSCFRGFWNQLGNIYTRDHAMHTSHCFPAYNEVIIAYLLAFLRGTFFLTKWHYWKNWCLFLLKNKKRKHSDTNLEHTCDLCWLVTQLFFFSF